MVESLPDDEVCKTIVEDVFKKSHHTKESREEGVTPYCVIDEIKVLERDDSSKEARIYLEYTVVGNNSNEEKFDNIVVKEK